MMTVDYNSVLVSLAFPENVRASSLRRANINNITSGVHVNKTKRRHRVFLIQQGVTELDSILMAYTDRQEFPIENVGTHLQSATPYNIKRLTEHTVQAGCRIGFSNIDQLAHLRTTVLDRHAGLRVIDKNTDCKAVVVPRQEVTFIAAAAHQLLVIKRTHGFDNFHIRRTISVPQNTDKDRGSIIDTHACTEVSDTLRTVPEHTPTRNLGIRIGRDFTRLLGIDALVKRAVVFKCPVSQLRIHRDIRHLVFQTDRSTFIRRLRRFQRNIDTVDKNLVARYNHLARLITRKHIGVLGESNALFVFTHDYQRTASELGNITLLHRTV